MCIQSTFLQSLTANIYSQWRGLREDEEKKIHLKIMQWCQIQVAMDGEVLTFILLNSSKRIPSSEIAGIVQTFETNFKI